MKFILLVLSGLFLGGCNLLELPAYVLFGQSHKSVKAEYRGLKGTTTAIIITTGPAVDFEYPYARTNVALAVAQAITENVKKVKFVDQDSIDIFQQENLDWASFPISRIGQKFGAQRVLYLDLYQFTMYEQSSINLLQGNATAALQIYEIDGPQPDRPAYRSEVAVQYPPNNPVAVSDAALLNIRINTIKLFADQLARKFYNHKVPLK